MNGIYEFNPYGLLQVDLEPFRSPLDPFSPFSAYQNLSVPIRPSTNGFYTSKDGLQLKEKGGEPVGTIVEKNN